MNITKFIFSGYTDYMKALEIAEECDMVVLYANPTQPSISLSFDSDANLMEYKLNVGQIKFDKIIE